MSHACMCAATVCMIPYTRQLKCHLPDLDVGGKLILIGPLRVVIILINLTGRGWLYKTGAQS